MITGTNSGTCPHMQAQVHKAMLPETKTSTPPDGAAADGAAALGGGASTLQAALEACRSAVQELQHAVQTLMQRMQGATGSSATVDSSAGAIQTPSTTTTTPPPAAARTTPTNLVHVGPNQRVPGTNLMTDSRGDLKIDTPGVTIDGIELSGRIKVQAANVTIRNSRINGPVDGSQSTVGLIAAVDARVKNLIVENCVLTPTAGGLTDGIVGHDFTARNNEIYGTVDGIGVFNTKGPAANVVIEGNHIHDLAWFRNEPNNRPEGTHNDGIQIQGGTNITIRNNHIETYLSRTAGDVNDPGWTRYGMQGIMVQNNVNHVSNVVIDGNTIDGGTSGVHVFSGHAGALGTVTVSNNVFPRTQRANSAGHQLNILVSGVARPASLTGLETNRFTDGTLMRRGTNLGITDWVK
jgi:hypothetical protein